MPMGKYDRTAYTLEYRKEKLKRITLDVPKEQHAQWYNFATGAGLSVAALIKTAVSEYMEKGKG